MMATTSIDNEATSNPCEGIMFAELCEAFQRIEDMSAAGSKETKNSKFTTIFTKTLMKRLHGYSLYPILRLVLPTADAHERGNYGLQQSKIADTYIQAIPLGSSSAEAAALKSKPLSHYDSSPLNANHRGDFGSTLEHILSQRVSTMSSDWTLGTVNAFLDKLVQNKDKLSLVREEVFKKLSPKEQKWMMRIILRDIGGYLGFKETYVFNNLWENAKARYETTNSLLVVCNELCAWQKKGGSGFSSMTDLDQFKITLFDRFSPMLARGLNNAGAEMVAIAVESMHGKPFLAEHKLDGERLIMHRGMFNSHMKDYSIRLFTRNKTDYTSQYKQVVEYGKRCIKHHDLACILDGEVLAWDNENKMVVPFGRNRSVAKIAENFGDDAKYWLKYVVFDIVYIEGPSAVDIIQKHIDDRDRTINPEVINMHKDGDIRHLPLAIRKEILKDIFIPETNRLELVPSSLFNSKLSAKNQIDLEAYFADTVNNGEEGLVVKSLSSPYKLGTVDTRIRADYWVKMKPDYGDTGAFNEIDVLVLGRFIGKGKSGRGWGFLCGVLEERGSNKFLTASKVGSGLSYNEVEKLLSKLKPYEREWDREDPNYLPEHFAKWKSSKDDRPEYWYPPEHSVVLQLKCNELIKATNYSAGYVCRFPRIESIRTDKCYEEIMTGHEFRTLMTAPRHAFRDGFNNSSSAATSTSLRGKKRKRVNDGKAQSSSSKKGSSIIGVVKSLDKDQEISSLFAGHTFCVFDSDYSKLVDSSHIPAQSSKSSSNKSKGCFEAVVNLIKLHGGNVVGTITKTDEINGTLCILGDQPQHGYSSKVRNEMDFNRLDFVHYRYLLSCIEAGNILNLTEHTHYYVTTCAATKFTHKLDTFGFKRDILYDSDILCKVFNCMDPMFNVVKAGKNAKTVFKSSIYDISILQDIENVIDLTWREIFNGLENDVQDQLRGSIFT